MSLTFRRGLCGLLLAGVVVAAAAAQSVEQVLAQTGLDPDLVAALTVEDAGGKVLLVFVFVNERTIASHIRPELAAALAPYVGKNAVLVWAYSEAGATFDPGAIHIAQGEAAVGLTPENVVPIDGDLLAGVLPPATPVAAVVLLGEGIDPGKPFQISYRDLASATLAVRAEAAAQAQAQASAEASAQASAQAGTATATPCPTCEGPSACDPCAWLCGWWTSCNPCPSDTACDPCSGPGFILPFLLLLLLGL